MKVTRADYAATCPWSGLIGKPDGLESSSELIARVDALAKQVEAALAAIGGMVDMQIGMESTTVEWIVGNIDPLQSVSEEFSVTGVSANDSISVTSQQEWPFMFVKGECRNAGKVRVTLFNSGNYRLSLGQHKFTITYIHA